MKLYAVMCTESEEPTHLVIASKEAELFSKLSSLYEISEKSFNELRDTGSAHVEYSFINSTGNRIKHVQLFLDTTEF